MVHPGFGEGEEREEEEGGKGRANEGGGIKVLCGVGTGK